MAQIASLAGILSSLPGGFDSGETIKDIIASISQKYNLNGTQLIGLLSTTGDTKLATAFEKLLSDPDENIGHNMARTVWVLLGISTVFLLARLAVKLRTIRRLFWDDACMISALVFGYIHAILITQAYREGLGRHLFFLTSFQRENMTRSIYLSLAWGFLSPMIGRLGCCVFLLFVAGIDPHIKKWTIYVFMVLQVLVNLGSLLAIYLQCGTHLDILWSATGWVDFNKYCTDPSVQVNFSYFTGSFNTFTDLFLTVVPGLMITHTSMPLRQKIGLVLLLCLSSLAMVAAIVKTYQSKAMNETLDLTFDFVPFVIWISIELNVVITVACIPFLRPLFSGTINRISETVANHGSVKERFESISLGSIVSKSNVRHGHSPSSSSQEHIAPRQDPFAITQTVEVSVVSAPQSVSLVHAALVGLVKDDSAVARVWH